MRIETIVIENINSLEGRFEIDFDDRAYKDGLFAIVGPSGSGKTTVLDAICLAIYGQTPRISVVSETQNELMNKNCAHCGAEAKFSAGGRRYKAVFYQKRGKAGKAYRAAKRELYIRGPEGDWQVIAERKREMDEKIEEITGLDFKRFTRSIMLAQFKFAEFLQADSNERAAILEQITDIDIYRRISVAVFERTKRQKAQMDEVQIRIGSVNVLTQEQKAHLLAEQSRLLLAISEHTEVKDKLSLCLGLYKNNQEIQKQLIDITRRQPALEAAAQAAQSGLEKAAAREQARTEACENLSIVLKTVRELDIRIKAQQKTIFDIEKEMTEDKEQILKNKNYMLSIFKKHYPDADDAFYKKLYDSKEAGEKIRLNAKEDLEQARNEKKRIQYKAAAVLGDKDEAFWKRRVRALRIAVPLSEAKDTLFKAQAQLKEQTALSGKLAEEKEKKRLQLLEAKEYSDSARIAQSFIEERGKLENGCPCPLCGSIAHPYAGREQKQSFVKDAQIKLELAQKSMDELLLQIGSNETRTDDLKKLIEEKTEHIKIKSAELEDAGGAEPLTTDELLLELSNAEDALERHDAFLAEQKKIAEKITRLTERYGDTDKDAELLSARRQMIDEIATRSAAREKEGRDARKTAEMLGNQRRELFGDKNADEEEAAAQKDVRDSQTKRRENQKQAEIARYAAENNRIDTARTQKALADNNKMFAEAYAKAAAGAAAVSGVSEDENIKTHVAVFTEAAARLGDNPDAEILQAASGAITVLISEEDAQRGVIGQILKSNEQSRQTLESLKDEEEKYKDTLRKWERLNALIGSRDGDKFCRIAQGITFDALLSKANTALSRMSDRYMLLRDKSAAAKPLELAVADNYQAGEVRPVANLSGGESFIVSLALALGLSEMSAGAARIDSLFIDEGFASLDEGYMEAALSTLLALGSREGKLIGVISHVDALKERIDVKIEVERLSGGRAALFGPGVKTVSC
ncbi:MAG: SbcC/MukB-like Walker B domain-containing protein [Christensenellales bacterium]